MIGETVSHYRIVERLGGGGMGEVYKAEDTKLGRFVALKFLTAEMSQDRVAMERFMLEARAAAALSHPHICTIHEINEHEGRSFIAMEYLEGQSLKYAIAGRPMPLDIVIDVGIQVAEALSAAHAKGITHRDIKPSNLFLSKSGQTKIVDFGLAKLTPQYRAASDDETQTLESGSIDPEMDLTRSGTALGTVSYMSPEQALGEAVDPRTDIFSLGAVLYEMVTGRQAFGGNTQAAIFNHLLNQPPTSPARLGITLPFEMERIISTALEKEADLRFQSADELAAALRRLKRDTESGQSVPGMAAVSRSEVASMVDAERQLQEAETDDPGAKPDLAEAQPLEATGSTAVAVEPALPVDASAVEVEVAKHRRWVGLLAAGLVLVLAVLGYVLWRGSTAPVLSESDVLLLTDFVNTTGDPVFDGTLNEALAVKLEESPYLKLAPERQVRETMAFMGLEEGAALTLEVGQEVCQRQGIKALVGGEVASLGSSYVVTLRALECASGETLAREQVQASSKEEVLAALGTAAAGMRHNLGESLASVEQYDAAVQQATTGSLEALKAFSLGAAKRRQGLEEDAIVHFKRAIELDPEFALAHARLGTVYSNLREWDKGIEQKTKAFELRDGVSEKENFYITAHYYSSVTGEVEKLVETYELWKDTYPRDWIPPNNLASTYGDIGWFDQEIEEARLAMSLDPDRALVYTTLLIALMHQQEFEEARQVAQEAVGKGLQHYQIYQVLYHLAYLEGDEAGMQAWLEAMSGRPGEAWLLDSAAGVAASQGRLAEARDLMRRAVEVSERAGFESQGAYLLAEGARREAAFGDLGRAAELAVEALDISRNRDSLPIAAIALAIAGATDEALQVIGELGGKFPTDTLIQEALIPIAMAAILRSQGDPLGAVEVLASASPYEKRLLEASLLRGLSYLDAEDGAAAAAEFRKILDLPGVEPTRTIHTLAHLGLARAFALSELPAASKQEYEAFFARVEGGDPGLPVVRQARAEYEALP